MTAQDALEYLVAALPEDFEDAGEIAALSRAAESQDKLDWMRQVTSDIEDATPSQGIWAEN